MGVQSFSFNVDKWNSLERPVIYIAKKDKEIIGSVSTYSNLSLTFNLNDFQTASFDIYREIDGEIQKYFDDFQEDRLIFIRGISWYKIHVETKIDNNGVVKSISANSLESTLCYKKLIDFECNTGEILYDNYVKTVFYDPINTKGSLLHRILNVAPNWNIGYVDDNLASKQRSFDVDDTDVYSFLTGDVATAFNCLFIFDTMNMTINAYDLDNYGKDANIFVSIDNFAQEMTESIDENSIITCYRVNGGDGIYINEINPNGTNKIYNFSYYLPQMPSFLRDKITAYNNKYIELKSNYESIMKRISVQLSVLQDLNTRIPSEENSKDWTKYGLAFLESKKKALETQDQMYIAQGMNNPDSFSYNLYKSNFQDLENVSSEYLIRQEQVNVATDTYNSTKKERDDIQNQLNMDNWFTKDEWKSLDCYIIEETYSNDNYATVDNTTDEERFDIERKLLESAEKDLEKKCRPQYQYSSTLYNLLTIPEFKDFLQYFELGNFIRMKTYDTLIKLRLISFTINFDSTSTIDVTFSDAIRVKDCFNDSASILEQVRASSMSFEFNKDQYDKATKQANYVSEIRKYGLDVSDINIHTASNQNQVWDETGMTFRMWNNQKNDYDKEQIRIINNLIAFYDTSGNIRTAIGKIPINKQGDYLYGVNAEVLMGHAILGEELYITNNAQNLTFTNDGLKLSNGINAFTVNPNDSKRFLSLSNNNADVLYCDENGKLHIQGEGAGLDISSNKTINIINNSISDINDNLDEETKNRINSDKQIITDMGTAIKESEDSIRLEANKTTQTICNSQKTWDISSYDITKIVYGYGIPDVKVFNPSNYNGKTYVDQLSGKAYVVQNNNWIFKNQLKSIQEYTDDKFTNYSTTVQMNAAIDLKASGIEQTVSKSQRIWDVSEYDKSNLVYGYGKPDTSKFNPSNYNGKTYVDQWEGKTYIITNSSWVFDKQLSLISDNLSSKITQNADKISAEIKRASDTEGTLSERITITENGISSKVSKGGEVISEINQSSDKIILRSNRLVVDSNNFSIDENGNASFSGNITGASGSIGGWNIEQVGFSASSYFNGKYYTTKIIPGQIEFTDSSNSSDSIYINPNGLGFGSSLSYISKDKIFSSNLSCSNLYFSATSAPCITWDNTLTFSTSSNVHFDKTPYIDHPDDNKPGYLARKNWCEDNFAPIYHTHSCYLTSSDLNGYVNYVSESTYSGSVSYAVRSMSISGNTLNYTVHPVNTSDERLKNITSMPDFTSVYMDLEPIQYTYKDVLKGYDHNVHFGLSAQRTKNAFEVNGYNYYNFGLIWSESPNKTFCEEKLITDEVYRLDKDELHALHIQMIQKHQHELETLQNDNRQMKIKFLEFQNKILILEEKLRNLEEE